MSCLGHRGDAEQRVGRERAPGRDVRHPKGALIEHAPAIGDQRDHARHVLTRDRIAQRRVDARAARRILRTRRTGGRSKHDAHADEYSHDVTIHESLPVNFLCWPADEGNATNLRECAKTRTGVFSGTHRREVPTAAPVWSARVAASAR